MDVEEALALIDSALDKISDLRNSYPGSPEHVEFMQSTGLDLARIFGPDSAVSKNFAGIGYQSTGSFYATYWTVEEEFERRRMLAFQRGLDAAEGVLSSARAQLERHGADEVLRSSRIQNKGGRIFISHGTITPALEKVERFIRALGLMPIVVMREPSKGMDVDEAVDSRLNESDCAIILATADEEVEGRFQPRPNVIHEIGLAQEKFGDKIIYLKEKGCEFPSNVRSKVWEGFTQDNMESAFEKISKELRAFQLL